MFLVPKIAMPHLIAALQAEIEQEKDMATWANGDDGPEGYDPNDLPLFEGVLKTLKDAQGRQLEEIKLSGKPLAFMVIPLPEYLRRNEMTLTGNERRALQDVLDRRASSRN